MTPTRDAAWRLLTEYTTNDRLLKHGLAVEAAVRGYAREFGEDEEAWGIVALLHDFDYEQWPSTEDHPYRGCEILKTIQGSGAEDRSQVLELVPNSGARVDNTLLG